LGGRPDSRARRRARFTGHGKGGDRFIGHGKPLFDGIVRHVYRFRDGLATAMEIGRSCRKISRRWCNAQQSGSAAPSDATPVFALTL
jgi:hypothetical protein